MRSLLLFIFLLTGCAGKHTLNLKSHRYALQARKVIWLQIPGLDFEHIALTHFFDTKNSKTSFENSDCVANLWSYNLFEVAPLASQSLVSQITGSKNINASCENDQQRPLWDYLKNYKTLVLESPTEANETLETAVNCQKDFFSQATFLKMGASPQKEAQFYNTEENFIKPSGIFYDRACQNKDKKCTDPLALHADVVVKKYWETESRFVLIFRDFSYYHLLQKNDLKSARNILQMWERNYSYWLQLAQKDPHLLILITSSAPFKINFPKTGTTWKTVAEKGEGVSFVGQSLQAPLFVKGASAENFCGFYEETDILPRLLQSMQKRSKLF
ncbi:MAG: hypothetical protein KBD63_05640 [Bacteriovoracaceae bacterium]|nr:hypothetical protein [Bacteriovoracaceae bacterium]